MSEKNFMQPCPPLVATYSYRRLPCRFEQRSQNAKGNTAKMRCPEYDYCMLSSRVLWRFELVYGRWIRVTLAEPSSSIVVRSEHHFNREERRRLSLRKHIYELSADHGGANDRKRRKPVELSESFLKDLKGKIPDEIIGKLQNLVAKPFADKTQFDSELAKAFSADEFNKLGAFISARAFSPLDCYRIQSDDHFGHYAGFVDLRPNSIGSPLAFAVLALPRQYRHCSDAFLITGQYGPLFGGPSFRSTVYSMHDPKDGGAVCAQACVIMALGLLADRGARISGSYTLTYLGKKKRDFRACLPGPTGNAVRRLGDFEKGNHLGDVNDNDGVRWHFDAAGGLGGLEPDRIAQLLNDRDVSACLFQEESNEQSGMLLERMAEAYVAARSPVILAVDAATWWPWIAPNGAAHAVIVIGIRKLLDTNELALITHDPGFIPFYERPFSECQRACEEYSGAGQLSAVFAAHHTVKRHAYHCVLALAGDGSMDREVFEQFLFAGRDSELDYQIRLLVRDNLAETFYSRSHLPKRAYVKQLVTER